MNNDFQNIGVNGARSGAVHDLIDALARNPEDDHPVLLWLSLIGNDVCNGHEGITYLVVYQKYVFNTFL